MNSDIVVISWWSNCLGLKCLHNLCQHTSNRNLFVVQAGKPDTSMNAFRMHLPTRVTELILPEHHSMEHWAICEWVVKKKLAHRAGVWFFDHDFIIKENCDHWLGEMDEYVVQNNLVMVYPSKNESLAITNPACWISPAHLPDKAPGFSPIPPIKNFMAQKPWKPVQQRLELKRPGKDTLVACMEYLSTLGVVSQFVLHSGNKGPLKFPSFSHLGGLYLFSYLDIPEFLYAEKSRLAYDFKTILKSCPQEWIDIEDPELMQRLVEFEKASSLKDSWYE